MKIKFKWIPKHSTTEKPDEQGRWTRICYVGNVPIAKITKPESKDYLYRINTFFPAPDYSYPIDYKNIISLEQAKYIVEIIFKNFLKECLLEEIKDEWIIFAGCDRNHFKKAAQQNCLLKFNGGAIVKFNDPWPEDILTHYKVIEP